MAPEEARRLSRRLFLLALAVAFLAATWAVTIDPPPNLDRYDYVGRAWHATQGEGLRPLITYPLRMVFPQAESFPPQNLTRPPLWPLLLVLPVAAGLGSHAGVWLALILFGGLLLWVQKVGDEAFGGGAGGFAALVLAASFTTWRVLVGGGPEIALALLTLLVWSWRPRNGGMATHLACGSLYGLMPLLHPTGWLLAGATFFARSGRYDRKDLPWLILGAAAVALPWHLHLWLITGNPLGTLQSYAELARNLDDPGGLGPYRGLVPHPTWQVLTHRGGEVAALGLHRLKMHLLHLDAWIALPAALLVLWGAAGEARLALRDILLVAAVAVVLSPFSAEFRPLFPLLPVICLWAGAGLARLGAWLRSVPLRTTVAMVAVGVGWLPVPGASSSPLQDPAAWPLAFRRAPARVVQRLQTAGNPLAAVFTESAHLAWASRRQVVFLPESPEVLDRLRRMPPLRGAIVLALGQGRRSKWVEGAAWNRLLARCTVIYEHPEGPVLLRLPPLEESGGDAAATPPSAGDASDPAWNRLVDPIHRLSADDRPGDLKEIPVPPATRPGLRLRAEALRALMTMVQAARADGVELKVVSAYRSWSRQEELYRRACQQHGPDQRWVAPPGASEHQLGTTVDFADHALRQVVEPGFAQTPEAHWLKTHAIDWGFHLSYPPDSTDAGFYHPEPWHYRYRPPAGSGDRGAPR